MKILFAIVVLFVTEVLSKPQKQQSPAEIVLYETDVGENNYNFQYETSDGVARSEQGEVHDSPDDPEGVLSVQGSYTYVDDQGKEHKVQYAADEKGFRILPGSSL